MTNEEISAKLKEYQTYQRLNGADEPLVDAMCLAVEVADGNKDPKFTVKVCNIELGVIREFILRVAKGTFEQLEQSSQE